MKFFFLLFLLCLDIASKIGAITWIPPFSQGDFPFGGIGIFSNFLGISFSLNYTENTGAAWGVFPGHPTLLFVFRFIIISGLIIYLFFLNRKKNHFPLWLVTTGAIGNVVDYILYGHVIDFFHFNFWGYSFPIFNFADSYITVGVLFFLFFEGYQKSLKSIPKVIQKLPFERD